ncbi:uncharacterized protein N7525_006455 [Penicillium rubens]|uniref:uncharacterized protein n=1 Tax=Penicillium rubens TaxID=1108849 RepID=UPI002A5A3CC7|nr:uncharacterized protein N7525_006455 [Penicillium rubens]KAJ5828202.1 hypothetical protein N7525_006455 [Penicillium rubens]
MDFAPHDPDKFLRMFRRIGPNIYDVPDDFIINLDEKRRPLYEPVDDKLWSLCAGNSTTIYFTLDRIYDVLLKSESCNHIWDRFKQPILSISRKSTIEELKSKKPGLYLVPSGEKRVYNFVKLELETNIR